MSLRNVVFASLALFLGAIGYVLGAIVVAIYAGIWLEQDKMAFQSGITPHLFGAAGALLGILLAWLIVKLLSALFAPRKTGLPA